MVNFWIRSAKKLRGEDSFNFVLWGSTLHIKVTRKLSPNDYIGAAQIVTLEEIAMSKEPDKFIDCLVDRCMGLLEEEEAKWRASQ